MNTICSTLSIATLALKLCLIGTSAPLSAANDPDHRIYGEWRSSRIGGGGYVMGVIPTSDPNTYYLYTDVGGLYRSDNSGEDWHMLHGALPADIVNQEPRSVVVDPRDPMRIVIATGQHWASKRGGIYVSADGGRSFRFTYPH